MKITSAHAIAFVALVASVGGGFAVAHNGDTDKIHFCVQQGGGNVSAVPPDATCPAGTQAQDVRTQEVAYHTKTIGRQPFKAQKGYRLVSEQLILPANGDSYVISGKVNVSKPARGSFRGTVTCRLNPTDNTPDDVVKVTLGPSEQATMAMETFGKTDGRPGQTAATEISCSAPGSRFVVRHVRITAVPVNTVSKGVPVA